jgi:hypothetical protein
MAAANVAMFAVIWDIYFDEELSHKSVRSILLDLAMITFVSAITAYITARATIVSIEAIIALLKPVAWLIAGLISGSVTGLLGIGWVFYCDDFYRHSK